MHVWGLFVAIAWGLASAAPARAQEAEDLPEAPEADTGGAGNLGNAGDAAADPEGPKSSHFRSLTKVRNGSMIRRAIEPPPPPDLRGEHERRRDFEVVLHFRRLAELDAIATIATNAGDLALLSQVDVVRRAEREHFRRAMGRLRWVTQAKREVGLP